MQLVVKLGGSILEDESIRRSIVRQIARIAGSHRLLLVHGGGKRLSGRLSQLGIASRFVGGLRATDETTLHVALMVLAGEVNKLLVCELAREGVRAAGLCGLDAGCVRCTPLSSIPGAPENLGFVGRPEAVEADFFLSLAAQNLVPVVASIALGPEGQPYNVNADQMASACAAGIGAEWLVYLTDVAGVLDGQGKVLSRLSKEDVLRLRRLEVISGGMLPKTEACLEALSRGVGRALILPGAAPEILIRAIEGNCDEGTAIHDTL